MTDQYWKPGTKAPTTNKAPPPPTTTTTTSKTTTDTNTLSKSVMSMKFMKRKLDSNSTNDNDDSNISNSNKRRNTNNNNNNENNSMIKNISYINDNRIYSTLPGRRSYGGCNKAVERQYEYIMNERRYEKQVDKANKNTISDHDMAQTLARNMTKSAKASRYYI